MAILGSIRRARVECFSYQCKRWYSHIYGINFMNDAVGGRRVQILGHGRTSEQFSATRSFAAPVQAKPKVEAKHTGGPRLNKAITSEFVRLVTDEGHSVVSRREALDRAMRLKLDLVEVHRNAKPPVCKIMDFHKEMYKQQLKEKDRLKGKSALTLRKGDCKEVRFTGKTEQKDLQMKADMVKRQMDRGYRVKCMAMGTEEEDLGGLLSRLFALIEDVAFVESGPRVEKRQAYVVVRHSKFGSTKKNPSKKVAKVVEAPSSEVKAAATSLPLFTSTDPAQIPLQVEEEWDHTESGSEMEEILSDEEADALYSSETPITTPIEEPEEASGEKMEWSAVDASDDYEKIFDFDGDSSRTTSSSTVNRSLGSVDAFSFKEDIADIAELLPKKLPVTSVVRGPDLSSADQRGQINKSGIVKNDLQEPKIHSPNPRWRPQPAVNAAPSTTQNPKSADNSLLRNLKPPSLDESRIHSLNPRWQPQPAVNAAPSTTQNPKSADNSPLRNLKLPSLDESRIHSPNPRWQPQPAVNAAPSTAQNPRSADNSPLRNLRPPSLDESKKQPRVDTKQGPSISSYGIFSAPKTAAPSFQRTSTEGNSSKERNTMDPVKSPGSNSVSSNPNPPKPAADSPRQDADKTKQRGWGIFSGETSGPNQHRNPESQMKEQR
ncbi:Translation initiation factor 3 [Cinnamomum micranthum f. kanehirae]|uniref:Translation initiation factor 3 n=1 Tax=Cinnamomum micranthum f. kanehirae TaxID=337451 RepID=A0A443PV46_9MAGN|nr:Translation initiation factor 3 [Cinnamomum micranthum f. kanehirae]